MLVRKSFEVSECRELVSICESLGIRLGYAFYEKGTTVYEQGAAASGCYLLGDKSWVMELYRSRRGRKRALQILGPGTLLGFEDVVLQRDWRRTLAKTLTDTYVAFIKAGDFQSLLAFPASQQIILSKIIRGYYELKSVLMETACPLRERLARFILRLDQLDLLERVKLTNCEIAEALGCSSVAISNEFSKLRRRGMVGRSQRRITVLDRDRLKALAGAHGI